MESSIVKTACTSEGGHGTQHPAAHVRRRNGLLGGSPQNEHVFICKEYVRPAQGGFLGKALAGFLIPPKIATHPLQGQAPKASSGASHRTAKQVVALQCEVLVLWTSL